MRCVVVSALVADVGLVAGRVDYIRETSKVLLGSCRPTHVSVFEFLVGLRELSLPFLQKDPPLSTVIHCVFVVTQKIISRTLDLFSMPVLPRVWESGSNRGLTSL